MIRKPALVIADEPTAYLDARNSRLIAGHLLGHPGARMGPADGHRLVLVTHDLALAARCDVVVLFDDGRLIAAGAPNDVIPMYIASYQC